MILINPYRYAVAGGGGGAAWFEVVTWTGNGTGDATVATTLDLSDGAMVWVKRRDSTGNQSIYFKATTGATIYRFNTTNVTAAATPTATLGNGTFTVPENISAATYVAWVFKKSAGNFNIVTWTGNGVAGRAIAHGLGSTPKMAFCCPLTGTKINYVQHQSLGGTQSMRLDSAAVVETTNTQWNNTSMDGTNLTLGSGGFVNGDTVPFAGFIFGGGDFEAGSFVGAAAPVNVTIGFQPRFMVIKRRDATTGDWGMFDTTRTPTFSGNDALLLGASTGAESSSATLSLITNGVAVATGNYNANGATSIYYAIK